MFWMFTALLSLSYIDDTEALLVLWLLPLFLVIPWILGVRVLLWIYQLGLGTLWLLFSAIWPTMDFWDSLCWKINKLLWWELRAPLICKSKDKIWNVLRICANLAKPLQWVFFSPVIGSWLESQWQAWFSSCWMGYKINWRAVGCHRGMHDTTTHCYEPLLWFMVHGS